MTTIAYKDGIIAYDSLLTRSGVITDSNYNKSFKVNNIFYFLTGAVCDYKEFLNVASGKQKQRDDIKLEVECFTVIGKDVFLCAIDDEYWKSPIIKSTAIGSGRDFAYAAMDCGCSAKEAVKIACNRDIYTGGKIRTYKIE